MEVMKDIKDIKWNTDGISEPIVMASAAGWYIGQLCKEGDFPMPFDRFTEYMSKKDALKLLKEDIF